MSAGKKIIEENKPFYWKVSNILGEILYYNCKYFIMWDVRSCGDQEMIWKVDVCNRR